MNLLVVPSFSVKSPKQNEVFLNLSLSFAFFSILPFSYRDIASFLSCVASEDHRLCQVVDDANQAKKHRKRDHPVESKGNDEEYPEVWEELSKEDRSPFEERFVVLLSQGNLVFV